MTIKQLDKLTDYSIMTKQEVINVMMSANINDLIKYINADMYAYIEELLTYSQEVVLQAAIEEQIKLYK